MPSTADFWGTFEALIARLAGRVPEGEHRLWREMWLDEEGLVVDMLAACLVEHRVPVTAEERDMVAAVLRHFDLTRVDRTHFPMLHDRETVVASLDVVETGEVG